MPLPQVVVEALVAHLATWLGGELVFTTELAAIRRAAIPSGAGGVGV